MVNIKIPNIELLQKFEEIKNFVEKKKIFKKKNILSILDRIDNLYNSIKIEGDTENNLIIEFMRIVEGDRFINNVIVGDYGYLHIPTFLKPYMDYNTKQRIMIKYSNNHMRGFDRNDMLNYIYVKNMTTYKLIEIYEIIKKMTSEYFDNLDDDVKNITKYINNLKIKNDKTHNRLIDRVKKLLLKQLIKSSITEYDIHLEI
jgi:hypothetical protein